MRKFIKFLMFGLLFFALYFLFAIMFLPKANLHEFGIYKTAQFEILGEKKNTIDAVVLGDSLVYSSISPMEIYGKYGYTVFDCAEAAQILPDAYAYYKAAIQTQKPKVALIEANMFFRDAKKRPWDNTYQKILKNSLPLFKYHNNWKTLFNGDINGKANILKGFKKNIKVKSSENSDYMRTTLKKSKLLQSNFKYFKKFVKYSKENNIKLIIIGLPSKKSWNYAKHKEIEELTKEYNLPYINLNLEAGINIDWEKDTYDRGNHLNYSGAKKVTAYIGNYLKKLSILKNHKNDLDYYEWNKAYHEYLKN